MSAHYSDDLVTLHHGDCLDVLRTLPDASVDAVVTDPPYGLEFMGKDWDGADGFRRSMNPADADRDNVFGRTSRTSPEYRALHTFQEWCEQWARECLRVLKPGGHILAFGGSRTWHRLAAAVEDAGFEIRDSIAWLYGSGFPKSLDVAKALDAGEGIVRGQRGEPKSDNGSMSGGNYERTPKGVAVTDAAKVWEGWGTALKPSFEPIVVGRKPLAGTVAANVLAYGTGALNIDATRIHTPGSEAKAYSVKRLKPGATRNREGGNWRPSEDEAERFEGETKAGRWPTNVVLDDSQAAALDEQTGVLTLGKLEAHHARAAKNAGILGAYGSSEGERGYGDSGGASRFFPTFRYEAKAPSSERPKDGEVQHPTVKPLDLMRWLVRLVTPPNGIVLEPFAGSGTTVEACLLEGFRCIAIEREADYLPLIMNRITKPLQQSLFGDWEDVS